MLKSLTDLLINELRDLYSAETQLVAALPEMEAAANDPDLKAAFRDHLEETKGHVERLDRISKILNVSLQGETCAAMKGLIEEGSEIISLDAESHVKDAALIAAAQRVEHYEMAGYGSAKQFAKDSNHDDVKSILGDTLDEEKAADHKLNKIATGGLLSQGINEEAVAAR